MKKITAEPYRIKVVEPIKMSTREEREQWIRDAGYNVFGLKAEQVYIDLLTDSGTSAMSDNQWAGLMLGDESYAGCRNFYNLEATVQDIFGFKYVLPTHQGRGAENIMTQIFIKPGTYVLGNMHFDSTRGHIKLKGGIPVDLVIDEGLDPQSQHPFKGNINVEKMESFIKEHGPDKISFVLITVTCNNNGGQPVSMVNIKSTCEVASKYNIPVMFDAARFAENCYFIRTREKGYENKSIKEIAREMFSYGDGCVMSSKKDGLVNIGGLFCTKHKEIYEQAIQLSIVYEGFPTYGGQAGRDMEALSRGLQEVIQEPYLADRIGQVQYLGQKLKDRNVPIVEPVGGHGVYVDAKRFLPNIPQSQFPGQAIVVALYINSGVRCVELGTSAFAEKDEKTGEMIYPELELVRLAIPRRVYTNRHMDVVAEGLADIYDRRHELKGFKIVYEAPVLRHFTARFEPLK